VKNEETEKTKNPFQLILEREGVAPAAWLAEGATRAPEKR